MTTYIPDVWVIVKLTQQTPTSKESHYRVLAGWYGGFTQGDSWKINSGIIDIKDENSHWKFTGESGSEYLCPKNSERFSNYTHSIYQSLFKQNTEAVSIEHVQLETLLQEFNVK